MRRRPIIFLTRLTIALILIAATPVVRAAPPFEKNALVLSKTYTIDRIYKSMEGPQSTQPIRLATESTSEVVWITGLQTQIVGPDGVSPRPKEFMCHINVDFDPQRHNALFGSLQNVSSRLFTLSQGEFEIHFPKGFGVPIMSSEPLNVTTQVLNHNVMGKIWQVRHRVTFSYVPDPEAAEPMKPLYVCAPFAMKLIEGRDGYYGVDSANEMVHGATCLPGSNAPNATMGSEYEDGLGRKFSGHWLVKPGREVNHTLVTKLMGLRYDTTVHFIAIHLHPFAESLELRDLTTGQSVYKSRARGFSKGIGLAHVDYFSSTEGLSLYKNHEYELISITNNTSGKNQDSMAVMLMYLFDKEFRKPHFAAGTE